MNLTAFKGLPAGTVLYLPPEFVRYTDPYGVPMVDILHYLEFVVQGQNFVPAFVLSGGLQTIQFIEILGWSSDPTIRRPVRELFRQTSL